MTDIAEQPLALLQQTMYARMTGDSTLMGLITGVFDQVPEDRPYDYVTLGEFVVTPDNRHRGFGRSILATFHIWTRARGHAPGLAIEARLIGLFDHRPLAVAGQHTVSVRYEFSQTLIDPEPPGDIRHIPLRFRVTTEQED